MKISLSAGHAKTTSGKQTPDGMKEWVFNAAVVKYLIDGLKNYENVQTLRLDDPTGKTDIPLTVRSNKANAWKSDVHIDVHANAAGPGGWYDSAKGIETFVYTSKPKEAVSLAQKVQKNLVSATHLQDRGVKSGDLHMLRETHMTSILIEAGFMTNRAEAKLLKTDNYRRIVAGAILDGLVSQYRLKKRAKAETDVKKEEDEMLEKAIVMNSQADLTFAEVVALRLKAPIYLRNGLPGGKIAKEVYIVGGGNDTSLGDKVIFLGGKDRFEVSDKVRSFLK